MKLQLSVKTDLLLGVKRYWSDHCEPPRDSSAAWVVGSVWFWHIHEFSRIQKICEATNWYPHLFKRNWMLSLHRSSWQHWWSCSALQWRLRRSRSLHFHTWRRSRRSCWFLNPSVQMRDHLGNRQRPADVFLHNIGNTGMCVSVTVVNGFMNAQENRTFGLTEALNPADDRKKNTYEGLRWLWLPVLPSL